MIDPPKRTGYRLTYDAQMYYDDWKEYGGCRCFQGNAPCSSCTHDGHPISLEENDEAWELDYDIADAYNAWKLKQEVDMSRSEITDKGGSGGWVEVLPTNLNSLTVGQEVKINEVQTRITKLDMSLDKSNVIGFFTARDITVDGNPNNFWGKHSHSDTKVWVKGNTQPADYTAYVVFKQESTGFGRNTYNGKEYAYKCSRDDYTQWVEYRAFDEDVFAEVNVSGVEKKVKVVRIEAKVDPKATKSIVRILPKELAIEKKTSRINNIVKVTINRDDFFSKDDVNTVIKHFNQQEEIGMSTTQRKVVEVQLFDDAKGLPVQDSLVAKFDNVLTEDDNDTTIREVIMNNDLKATLKAHNAKRAKVTNLDILERTGNSVPLQPILLKDLRWKVIG